MPIALSGLHFCFMFISIVPLIHGQSYGDLRLMQKNETDPLFTEGRLEIFINGEWGTICEDNFDSVDANVACRQLGYNGSRAEPVSGFHSRYGKGSDGPIWLDEVGCTDTAGLHILSCPSRAIGVHDCDHFSDIAVICSPTRLSSVTDLSMLTFRLQGGKYPSEGRLEVYCNGEWGTVCNRNIEKTDANAVCRQLGYTEASNYDNTIKAAHTNMSNQPIWFDTLDCQNGMSNCGSCPSSDLGLQSTLTCSSNMTDLVIQCNHSIRYGSVRLAHGNLTSPSFSTGRTEIFLNGNWRTICPDNLKKNDGDIICHALGYLRAKQVTLASRLNYGQGMSEVWLKEPDCILKPNASFACLISDKENKCTQDDPLAVVCTDKMAPGHPPTNTTTPVPLSIEILIAICLAGAVLLCFCCLFMVVCCTHLCCGYHISRKKRRLVLVSPKNLTNANPKHDKEYLEMKLSANRGFLTGENPPRVIPFKTPQTLDRVETARINQAPSHIGPYPFPRDRERINLRCGRENLSSNKKIQSNLKQIADQLQPPDEFQSRDSIDNILTTHVGTVQETLTPEPDMEPEARWCHSQVFNESEEETQALKMSFTDNVSTHSGGTAL